MLDNNTHHWYKVAATAAAHYDNKCKNSSSSSSSSSSISSNATTSSSDSLLLWSCLVEGIQLQIIPISADTTSEHKFCGKISVKLSDSNNWLKFNADGAIEFDPTQAEALASPSTIAKRTATGSMRVGDPSHEEDAVNKKALEKAQFQVKGDLADMQRHIDDRFHDTVEWTKNSIKESTNNQISPM